MVCFVMKKGFLLWNMRNITNCYSSFSQKNLNHLEYKRVVNLEVIKDIEKLKKNGYFMKET